METAGQEPIITQGRPTVAAAPIDVDDVVRVVSWNIRFGIEVDRAAQVLAAHPDLVDADVILVQEMDETGIARLAELLSMEHVYATLGRHAQSGRNFGNGVLSRHRLGRPIAVRLPFASAIRGTERLLLRTDVVLADRVVDVASVHTEVPTLSGSKRRAQFDVTARNIGDDQLRPGIVGGDFNTVTDRGISTLTSTMAAVGAYRATVDSGPTLRRGGRRFTLDHVFVRGFETVASGVVPDRAASDHAALWTSLRSTLV